MFINTLIPFGILWKLVESCEDHAEAQQENKYQTCIKPIKQMTGEHLAQEEMEEGSE